MSYEQVATELVKTKLLEEYDESFLRGSVFHMPIGAWVTWVKQVLRTTDFSTNTIEMTDYTTLYNELKKEHNGGDNA